MKSKKTTRRALFSSVMALILCCAMLVGSTFAWFTDSVSSVNNVITAGNLDVELYYKDAGAYKVVDPSANLLQSDLWEPGHVQVLNLKVANLGTLALKYQLNVSVIEETTSTSVEGTPLKLSDYIKFAVIPNEFTGSREQAVDAAEGSAQMLNTGWITDDSTLYPQGSTDTPSEECITLIVWMPEDVGNEANYDRANGAPVPTIKMGINLYATQLEAEEDSFGPDYDEDATYIPAWDGVTKTAPEKDADGVYHITSGEELAGINAILATLPPETGIKVALDADINLGSHSWSPIGTEEDPFVGTFDGQGHTIYNVNVITSGNAGEEGDTGLFGVAQHEGTIKNLTVENVSVNLPAGERVGALIGKTLLVDIVNCHVKNATVIGESKVGGLVGDVVSADVTNCSVNNTTVIGEGRNGGLIGRTREEGKNPTVTNNTVSNSTVYATAADSADYFVGENVTNTDLSTNTQDNVTLVKNTPVTTISTAEELVAWAANPTSGDVLITADIDMSGVTYTPVKASGVNFVLDGQGNTISNLTTNGHYGGLIGKNNNGDMTIKNLNLTNVSMTGDNADGEGSGGVIIGYYEDHTNSTVVIENCHVDGMTSKDFKFMGGLVGYTSNSGGTMTITNCSVSNATLNSTYAEEGEAKGHVGGLVGRVHVTTVTGCTAENVVINTNRLDRAGAICGTVTDSAKYIESNNTMDVSIPVTASSDKELADAISAGATDITLPAGNYTLASSNTTADIKIVGTKDTIVDMSNGTYMDSASSVTLEGVTIKLGLGYAGGNGSDYTALYAENATFINCTFEGGLRVGRNNATFINCTFNLGANDYVYNYGNHTVFEGCTFNTAGKALISYSDGNGDIATMTVKNCTFNATQKGYAYAIVNQPCAAIEIDNYGCGVVLTTSGNTIDDNFSGEWRIKSYDAAKDSVTVNGTEYTSLALDGKTMTIDSNRNVTVSG